MNRKFIIFHQPKTAGTFVSRCIPESYIFPHSKNYHYALNNNLINDEKLVCIVRNPYDYYISLITFWCIDDQYVQEYNFDFKERLKRYNKKLLEDKINIKNHNVVTGHINFYISNGFTLKIKEILENLFNDNFLKTHCHILSERHHTYDYYVFHEMLRLNIGYYTFAFLDQYGSKKITELKSNEDCLIEIKNIKKNFKILHTNKISSQLKELCEELDVHCNILNKRIMVSNKNLNNEFKLTDELKKYIYEKDKHIFDEFFNI